MDELIDGGSLLSIEPRAINFEKSTSCITSSYWEPWPPNFRNWALGPEWSSVCANDLPRDAIQEEGWKFICAFRTCCVAVSVASWSQYYIWHGGL